MSIGTPQTESAAPAVAEQPRQPRELRVYGHSTLFYWWPVWVTGFIMGIITYVHDSRLAIVPAGSQYREEPEQNIVLLPQGKTIESGTEIKERVHPDKSLGVIFVIIVLVVILITNVPLRGLSSAIAILLVLFFTVLSAWMGWWDKFFECFSLLSLHMNMGFYFFLSAVLLIVWLLVFFVYDRLSYWKVRPGQITHEFVFGGGEKSYSTDGMTFEKLRDDLFRHWVLGFGSGDMVMYPMQSTSGGREELHVSNVLFVGGKLKRIQELIAERPDADAR